jgi:cytochrome c oxidase cbb3-type subunit 3
MKQINSYIGIIIKAVFFILIPAMNYAQQTATPQAAPPGQSLIKFDMDTALFFIAATLAVVILFLTGVMRSAVRYHFNSKKINDTIKLLLIGVVTTLSLQYATAQATAPVAKSSQQFLLSSQGWFMLIIIVIELYVLFSLKKWLKFYTGIEAYESSLEKTRINLWDKINAFKPMDKEASIDVGHDYDGIRELDNITPPWFVAAFTGTIIFAAIYLYRYHVAYSAPNQIKEYEIAIKEAEIQKLEYLKYQGNQIDENSVTLLKEGEYEEGKTIFKTACAVCHGVNGQGLVGPNFTDDYWLHGGSVKDIFTTIKYGVIDKGMKSWKDDYSPNQIAQLTSYIKSLKGTNPPDQKAPQGNLYKEEASTPPADTSKAKQDSLQTKK